MYRIYGAKAIVVVIAVVVRVEHVIAVHVRVRIAQPEIRIARVVSIHIARSNPNKNHEKNCPHPDNYALFIDFFQPTKYFTISSIASPNFK